MGVPAFGCRTRRSAHHRRPGDQQPHRREAAPAAVAGGREEQIEEALVRSAETDAKHIEVEVRGDKVILTGTVRAWAEKKEAERVAWSAPGVASVENRIVVSF